MKTARPNDARGTRGAGRRVSADVSATTLAASSTYTTEETEGGDMFENPKPDEEESE